MRINYDKIREDNIREYGQGTRHLAFLGRLYTDRTHFIFELLQNAEDAGATQILFSLFADRLEVAHDGRPFNEQDVRGICGVGEGTKSEDLTQIGKFGIGFKSVYAYTTTPEVHSGGEGFRIENYVRPYAVTFKPAGKSWSTLFVFPFNTKEITPENAYREISERLRNLSARTLLFLRRLNEIEYRLPNATEGIYLREESTRGSARQISVIGQNNGKDEEENWLIFERSVPVPGNSELARVEAAFQLAKKGKDGKNSEQIVGLRYSPLAVYFPTEKETRLGFLIQGPYRTTPSRDNIPKDDDWNKTLIKETAELVGDMLPEIKNLGLLSVSFLEALPIKTEDFPEDSMFYPIFESVRNILRNEEFLPADDGSFVSAKNAKLARGADLRKLLSQEQLGQLYRSSATIKWLSGEITLDRTPALRTYLINELEVEEVKPDDFARKMTSTFLSCQSDEWFIDFYKYLLSQEALWKAKDGLSGAGHLRKKPIIRCQDGQQRAPFDESDNLIVFLPIGSRIEYPVVRKSIYENANVAKFMGLLGLVAPDICTQVLNDIIPLYQGNAEVEDSIHIDHISVIADAMKLEGAPHYSKMISALKNTTWVLAANSKTGELVYDKPTNLFLNLQELHIFFENNVNIFFLAEKEEKINWQKLGVHTTPIIRCRGIDANHNSFVNLCSYHGCHKRGINGFDPDTSIDELEYALMHISVQKAKYIWNELLPPLIRFLHGRYQEATHQNYDNATTYEVDSTLCKMLKKYHWLPVISGEFKKPSDCTIADLVGELKRNQELSDLLGVQLYIDNENNEVEKEGYAVKLGTNLDDIEFMKNHYDEYQQWKATLASRKGRPTFPARPVVNPERRQEHLRDDLTSTPRKEYQKRETSIRTTSNTIDPTAWLRNQYTNEVGQMVCQICKDEMPFKKRNGEYYFEKKEILSREYLPKEYEAQYLALCPLCAAKYQEFVKNDNEVMSTLKEKLTKAEGNEISIALGDEQTSIRFVETHLQDLKVILNEAE